MLSVTFKDNLLNLLRGINATAAVAPNIALYTGAVGTGPEVSGGSYARQTVSFAAPLTSGLARLIRNNAEVSFPQATANWGTITHAKILDGATLYATAELATPKDINVDDTAVFGIDSIEILLSDA